jgi:hypothetical protein
MFILSVASVRRVQAGATLVATLDFVFQYVRKMSASEAQYPETLRILATDFQTGVSISKSPKTSGLSSPMLTPKLGSF